MDLRPTYKIGQKIEDLTSHTTRNWFYGNEIKTIYNIPIPSFTGKRVVGVVSFGGGLYGDLSSNGILTNSDCHNYWSSIGISNSNMPIIKIVSFNGAINNPGGDFGSTIENSIDVQSVGTFCPSSDLIIILYLAPNSFSSFVNLMNYIINTDINISGVNYRPNIVSISWGAPEIYWSSNLLDSMNSAFLALANIGVNITCAAGDNGSSDGTANDNCCDFPSSSPNVIAVGGTTLTCSNYVYDGSTSEIVWSGTGGAKSNHFNKPSYQSDISGTKRSTPDLSLIADPNTGVLYKIGGSNYVIGGTSISSPFIAGYLAAINLNSFLNNYLYDLSSNCFHDITSGSNGLYNASVGYDNCSGFGTIIGTVMKNQLNISPTVSVQIVQISNPRIFIDVGKTYQYSISIFPANATNQNVSWSSSNPSIISVNNGLITGLSLGKATISVITQDGNFTSSVYVNSGLPMKKISFSKSKYSTKVGRSISLSLTISPTNPSDKTISWSVSNNVGTITNGKVKGNRVGSAVVIARSTTYNLFAKTIVTFTK